MFRTLTLSAVAAAAVAASTPASAESLQVGILECGGGQSFGYLIGSSSAFNCVFRPANGRRGEGYGAAVNRIGLDLGITTGTAMGWLVFAPSRNLPRGALAGNYGGVSANASIGIGGGANVLVGGMNNSITLQPVSLQGQTGLNVAAAVTGVELRAMSAAPGGAKKKSKKKKS